MQFKTVTQDQIINCIHDWILCYSSILNEKSLYDKMS